MSPIHPPLLPVPVAVATQSGIVSGTIYVPEVLGVLGYLNQAEELIKLTDARIPGSSAVHPFLAIRKPATSMVVPSAQAMVRKSEAGGTLRERRSVTCLLVHGSISGALEVPESLRTSDYLLRANGFIDLYHCRIDPDTWGGGRDPADGTLPVVLVNTHLLVGITESA